MNRKTISLRSGKQRLVFWLAGSLATLLVYCSAIPITKPQKSATPAVVGDQVAVKYAKGFRIKYVGNYKYVSIINPFGKTADTIRYVLVQRGTPPPKGYNSSQIITVPLRSIVAMSSMHIGLAAFLGAEDLIVGLANLQYVSSPKVLGRIKAGKVAEIGRDQTINEEQLVTMHPDLVMTMGSPAARMDRYSILKGAGIPVLINSEWVENTPLARAEWVKLMAALLNKETLVNQKFSQIEQEYNRLASLTKRVSQKPLIISGINTKDAWYVPDGNSFMTRFFLDAGGSYPWTTRKATGSLPLNFETVYPYALKADCWLNVSIMASDTKQSILAKDARYADFKAFKTGQMYDYNKRTNSQGSNDYWESGVMNPHLVLADMIKILHPNLLPKHELVYYRKLN